MLNEKTAAWLAPARTLSQSFFLLIIRLYWGWEFFQTGKGKLMDLEKPTQFFQSLGIPFPHAQAILCGKLRCQFSIDPARRTRLLNGWDDLDVTNSFREEIAAFKTADRKTRPWAIPSAAP